MEAGLEWIGGRLTWTEGRAEGLVSHPVLLHVLDGSGADDGGRGEKVRGERVERKMEAEHSRQLTRKHSSQCSRARSTQTHLYW